MNKIRKKRTGVGIGYYAAVFVFLVILAVPVGIGVIGDKEIRNAHSKGELTLKGKLPSLDLDNINWKFWQRNPDKPKGFKKLPHTWKNVKGCDVYYESYEGRTVRVVINKGRSDEESYIHDYRQSHFEYHGNACIRTFTLEPLDTAVQVQYGLVEK
jgi:hypothetical protein